MTVLIDTNVILDYVLQREPFADAAYACLDRLITGKAKAWLTASTITDIYYVTRRTLKDAEKAKSVISKLLNAFFIAGVDKADCLSALDIGIKDYEDALVSICAKKVKCEYIITRNVKDFVDSPVPAILPADYLRM
ncbi:MAG: PIN domain-containing protein [Clostridia bacterium]|nr:PIN domain-containing protein [Clostridia bacterium]